MATQPPSALLGPDDPAPVILFNTDRPAPFLLIGDHAGRAIPASLGTLGLSWRDRARHIACDIGSAGLGEALAWRLDAAFIHQAYSRLVVDCNRHPGSPDAMPEQSDGIAVPGNSGLDADRKAARVNAVHAPYHRAIAAEIDRRMRLGQPPILVSLHSFTPAMAGRARPWHAGILYGGGNPHFARKVLEQLRREVHLVIGDNEPYRMDETDYTIPRHAFGAGLAYVELEVRQDLLADEAGQRHWGEMIAAALLAANG